MKNIYLILALLSVYFSAFSQAPTIISFSPVSGPVGTLVTVTGTNLGSPTAFSIGGVSAIVISGTGDSLVGMVMPGAATGSVYVTTAGGSATAGRSYTLTTTTYPHHQQGSKLQGTAEINGLPNGGPDLGYAVGISADGNTAVAAGFMDDNGTGALWVYTRSGSTWTQQGPKLLDAALSRASVGYSVAISADGNTILAGASTDSTDAGAGLIFTRTAGTWTQQGPKLQGTGAVWSHIAGAGMGYSAGLSADGNTAILGGPDDIPNGAAWIFTRTGSTWSQQGQKLVGTGSAGGATQGISVALSADGNTAIVGGPADSGIVGAAWIYTRNNNTWTQQGRKLVGTGVVGTASQGSAVALSADGNTAIIGGKTDNNDSGAVWIFTRSGTTWSQQGSKLVGTGAAGAAEQGISVALSADGNTAMVGGNWDASDTGAVWVFTRTDTTWSQQGSKLVGSGLSGGAGQGTSVAISADGTTALIGGPSDYDAIGTGAVWVFSADSVASTSCIPTSSYVTQTICPGDTFLWANSPYTASGYYTNTLTNAAGCDSVMSLYLLVLDSGTAYFYMQPADSAHSWYIVLPASGQNITYTWQWGDSTSSTGDTVSHTYSTAGYYNICLTISDSAGCLATYCDTGVYLYKDQSGQIIHVQVIQYPAGITEVNTSSIHLYPNPNKGSFTLQTASSIGSTYTISDVLGQIISKQTIHSDAQVIDLPNAINGVYLLSMPDAPPVRFVIVR